MIQRDKTFVNVSLFILIAIKILQKTDYFAQQQRVKLFNTQIMKKLSKEVFSNVNRNYQFSQKTKIDENSYKEKWQLKNDILYANKDIEIPSKKFRNALLKQNHDNFYAKYFEYEKVFELIRRKYWWFNLIQNIKKYFEFCIDCSQIKFTKHMFYNFLDFKSISKNFRQDWILNFIHNFFSCRFLNEIYDNKLVIVNRFTKYAIYISVRKNWKIKNLANVLTNNVFKYFDMFVLIVNDRKSLFIWHF